MKFDKAIIGFLVLIFFFASPPSANASLTERFFKSFFGVANTRQPVDEIKIIGAGYGRTGTSTLKQALEILGYPTYHMQEVKGAGHGDAVLKAYNGHEPLAKSWFDDITRQGFSATCDFPTAGFYKEQMELYPEAKVILTLRDSEKWFQSFTSLMNSVAFFNAPPFKWANKNHQFLLDTIGSKTSNYAIPACIPTLADIEYYTPLLMPWVSIPIAVNIPNKTRCIQYFNDHNEEVKKYVPRDKLLVMEASEGWKPLCELLGANIPDVPFPKTNTSAQHVIFRKVFHFIAYAYPFLFLGAVGVCFALIHGLKKIFVSYEENLKKISFEIMLVLQTLKQRATSFIKKKIE